MEGVVGRPPQTYSLGIRRTHGDFTSFLVQSWRRIWERGWLAKSHFERNSEPSGAEGEAAGK
jgi:hypothetical protein